MTYFEENDLKTVISDAWSVAGSTGMDVTDVLAVQIESEILALAPTFTPLETKASDVIPYGSIHKPSYCIVCWDHIVPAERAKGAARRNYHERCWTSRTGRSYSSRDAEPQAGQWADREFGSF